MYLCADAVNHNRMNFSVKTDRWQRQGFFQSCGKTWTSVDKVAVALTADNQLPSLHSCLVSAAVGSAAAFGLFVGGQSHTSHLLHGGLVQLVEIQRVDAVLGPKYQVLI